MLKVWEVPSHYVRSFSCLSCSTPYATAYRRSSVDAGWASIWCLVGRLGHTKGIPVSTVPNLSALRSASSGDLVVPSTRLQLGNRAFNEAGSVAWNSLVSTTGHLFGTDIINVQKQAQDTSVLSFLLHRHDHARKISEAYVDVGGLGK